MVGQSSAGLIQVEAPQCVTSTRTTMESVDGSSTPEEMLPTPVVRWPAMRTSATGQGYIDDEAAAPSNTPGGRSSVPGSAQAGCRSASGSAQPEGATRGAIGGAGLSQA